MNFDDTIQSRRSIRRFAKKEVEADSIRSLIETARLSPSAKNRQPWFFCVLNQTDKDKLFHDFLEEADRLKDVGAHQTAVIFSSAPVAIAVYTDEKRNTSDILSIGAAMYSICLKATDLGLGSLWLGDTDILNKSEKYKTLVGVILIGYPEEYPAPRSRKEINEISNLYASTAFDLTDDIGHASLDTEKYVFVSYSHCDKDVVVADICELKHHGIPLWYDKALVFGERWDDDATSKMQEANCIAMLLYVSYNSLSSPNVFKEFLVAQKNKLTRAFAIIPIVIGTETVSQLIARLRVSGLADMADAYEGYFGTENQTLYIERSIIPQRLAHMETLLLTCHEYGIIDDYRVYDKFSYIISNSGCVITEYHGFAPLLTIPKMISDYPVVEIGQNAFSNNSSIKKVIVPNTVKRLALGAFLGSSLEEIDLPDSIEEICTACFRDCVKLESIKLPPRISYLSEALFRGCTALRSIEVPYGVVEMKEAVFRSCSSLERAIMPATLKQMTEGGFYGCTALKDLVIPREVVGVEKQSFDTSLLLNRVCIGDYIFEKGKVHLISGE